MTNLNTETKTSSTTGITSKLANHALLVALTVSKPSFRKHDKKATRELLDSHQSQAGMARVNKLLIAKKGTPLEKVETAFNAIRTTHYARTLPWAENARILSTKGYMDYCNELRVLKQKAFDILDTEFLPVYDSLVNDAKYQLGDMFDSTEYPTAQELRQRYKAEFSFLPLPNTDDFRIDLAQDQVDRIKQHIQATCDANLATATDKVVERLVTVVKNMMNSLDDYGTMEDGRKRKKSFKDSLVGNITELCDLMPTLNITGDQTIDALTEEVRQQLTRYSPQVLRENAQARQETAEKAEKILEKMNQYL